MTAMMCHRISTTRFCEALRTRSSDSRKRLEVIGNAVIHEVKTAMQLWKQLPTHMACERGHPSRNRSAMPDMDYREVSNKTKQNALILRYMFKRAFIPENSPQTPAHEPLSCEIGLVPKVPWMAVGYVPCSALGIHL